MRDGPCGHVCGHDTLVSLSTTCTELGPWLLGGDQVPDRSHPRHLLCICRQLEPHGDQRVGLKVGNRRVVGAEELWRARPSSGIGLQPTVDGEGVAKPGAGLVRRKAVDGTGPIYVLRHVPEGSAGALCETPGDADTLA